MNNKEKLYLAKYATATAAAKMVANLAEDKPQSAGSFGHNRASEYSIPPLNRTFRKERNVVDKLTQEGMGNQAAEADIIRANMLLGDAESSQANKAMAGIAANK
jgi:hypothetical protein